MTSLQNSKVMGSFDSSSRKPRAGLAGYKLQSTKGREARFCENVVTSYRIVGFSTTGIALHECDDMEEAISVPDVAIIRIRDFLSTSGYRFARVLMKTFKIA